MTLNEKAQAAVDEMRSNTEGNVKSGILYGTAVEHIETEEEAQEYLTALVMYLKVFCGDPKYRTEEGATSLAKENIGYYAGYYSHDHVQKVNRLFGAVHPVFGLKEPTVTEAFHSGMALSRGKTPEKARLHGEKVQALQATAGGLKALTRIVERQEHILYELSVHMGKNGEPELEAAILLARRRMGAVNDSISNIALKTGERLEEEK